MATWQTARRDNAQKAVAASEFDALIGFSAATVCYVTGYASVAGQLSDHHKMAVVLCPGSSRLVLPASDRAAAVDMGINPDEMVSFGRFYFESAQSASGRSSVDEAPVHAGVVPAIVEALRDLELDSGRIAVESGGSAIPWAELQAGVPDGIELVCASSWAQAIRRIKTPEEIELLRQSAQITERGIDAAIAVARPGMTEKQLSSVIARTMIDAGATPRFLVVTSGPRSALADAWATDRPLSRGDLLRFDVGCVYQGYWSDLGRTAVVGQADSKQRDRYAALLAGEQDQLDASRPGATAGQIFDVAMNRVRKDGLAHYRRHHCGHGIGMEVYEAPIISSGEETVLEEGMTFCFETPYYEIGWGGMMVEDTVAITEDGIQMLSSSDRSLREIPV